MRTFLANEPDCREEKKGNNTFIPFLYSGQYIDVETGLYYNRFRYYSPQTGSYISKDPIGLAGNNPNFYAYVHDSNVWVDQFGLMAQPKGTGLNWNGGKLGPNDLDLRGSGTSIQDALNTAFEKTGVPKESFDVTKWGTTEYGKSFPVEWKSPINGAEVNLDYAHYKVDELGNWATGPDAPHVGWQYGKKNKTVGHILVDDVPAGRSKEKIKPNYN